MNTQKALTTLIFIAASLIVTLIVAQFLPSDAKYVVILIALLVGVGGASRPVIFLTTQKKISIL